MTKHPTPNEGKCWRQERETVKVGQQHILDEINTHLHPQQFQGFGLKRQQKQETNRTRPCRMYFIECTLYKYNTVQTDRQADSLT